MGKGRRVASDRLGILVTTFEEYVAILKVAKSVKTAQRAEMVPLEILNYCELTKPSARPHPTSYNDGTAPDTL